MPCVVPLTPGSQLMSEQQQHDNATTRQASLRSRRRFLLGLVTAGLAYSAPTLLGLDEAHAYSRYTYRSPRSRRTYRSPRSRHSYYGYPPQGGYHGPAAAPGGYQGPAGGGYQGGTAPAHGGGFRQN